MSRLFVSYARPALQIVESLVDDLRELGHDPFYDHDLVGGQQWWTVLLDRIETADGFLPVLSADYRSSEACESEAGWAQALGKPFLPIDLGELRPELCARSVAEANWVAYDITSRASVTRLARAVAALPAANPPGVMPPRPGIPVSYLTEIEREIRSQADLPWRRQLTIMAQLGSKLQTREQESARQLLLELRRRPDLTYQIATEIDSTLMNGPSPEPTNSDAPAQQPFPPPAQPDVPDPPIGRSTARRAVNPIGLLMTAIGAVLVVLSLTVVNWQGGSTKFTDFKPKLDDLGSGNALLQAYFGSLAWVLLAVCTVLGVIAAVSNPRPTLFRVLGLTAGLLAALVTVLAMNKTLQGLYAGFWLAVAGFVLVALAASLGPRRV